MKYTVAVSGEAALGLPEQDFELEASTGDDAVNAVREHLHNLAPKEGGDLDVEVTATEEWIQESKTQRGGIVRETVPPGVVSRFSIRVEPHDSVRAEIEAKRAAAEAAAVKAAEREAIKAELRLEMEAEQKAGGKVAVSK